jgi:hypothetical protein
VIPALDYRELPLSNSPLRAKVDSADYELVRNRTWRLGGRNGHVITVVGGKTVQLHRLIMGVNSRAPEVKVWPLNGNRLDCRRTNLLPGSLSASNSKNIPGRKPTTSQHLGVTLSTSGKRWKATISLGRTKYVGTFDTEIEAAKARDAAARSNGLPEDNMNFPPPDLLDKFESRDV